MLVLVTSEVVLVTRVDNSIKVEVVSVLNVDEVVTNVVKIDVIDDVETKAARVMVLVNVTLVDSTLVSLEIVFVRVVMSDFVVVVSISFVSVLVT